MGWRRVGRLMWLFQLRRGWCLIRADRVERCGCWCAWRPGPASHSGCRMADGALTSAACGPRLLALRVCARTKKPGSRDSRCKALFKAWTRWLQMRTRATCEGLGQAVRPGAEHSHAHHHGCARARLLHGCLPSSTRRGDGGSWFPRTVAAAGLALKTSPFPVPAAGLAFYASPFPVLGRARLEPHATPNHLPTRLVALWHGNGSLAGGQQLFWKIFDGVEASPGRGAGQPGAPRPPRGCTPGNVLPGAARLATCQKFVNFWPILPSTNENLPEVREFLALATLGSWA